MRRIGSALRKAREENGLTMDTACRRYGRSKGWLSTLENGLHPIDPQELSDLLDFYGVPDGPLRESLLHLAKHNPGKNWQRAREGWISAAALDLASLEEDSVLIQSFQPNVIPGLLQTEEYAWALMKAGLKGPKRNNAELVRFRMSRQRLLARKDAPRYETVIGEAALRQQVGGASVMRAQIRKLIESPRRDQVALHVLPLSSNADLGIAGSFDIFTLGPPGQLTVAVAEDFTRSTFVESEAEVLIFEKIFAYFRSAALDEASSLRVLQQIASDHEHS
ncbi:helix-turn-helix domain-containing protein [Actinoallomurus purpureus]|nr:helix-turn-helix domain-containing protein [Actinoallomurus purpureus]